MPVWMFFEVYFHLPIDVQDEIDRYYGKDVVDSCLKKGEKLLEEGK